MSICIYTLYVGGKTQLLHDDNCRFTSQILTWVNTFHRAWLVSQSMATVVEAKIPGNYIKSIVNELNII